MSTVLKTAYRPAIDRVTPYAPGKPIEEVARELGLDPGSIVKLASNENPLGPSPLAVEAMREHLTEVRLYPDDAAFAMRHALGDALHVRADQILLGRGSDEVMHFIATAYLVEGDEVVMGDPPFSMYEISTNLMGANPVKVPLRADYAHDLEAMAAAITERTKLVYVANPHNPTGAYNTKAELDAFLAKVPESVLVVLDEAYYQYAAAQPDFPNSLDYVRQGRNVIVLHTFSKIYALAGLRIGYGVTSRPEVLRALHQVREPFNVANLAQWAAIASLQDPDHVKRGLAINEIGKQQLYSAFTRLGLDYVPTHANFVLVDTGKPCGEIFNGLLRQGVIVRSAGGFGYPTKIRVTFGTEAENGKFVGALETVLG